MLIDAGSRDEVEGRYGLAHLIEHLLFKQTERRNTNQILNRLESVGGDLNAYTTKEYTCIHASFLTPYLERALDLFEDLFFHSVFSEQEIEKEKGVILDEMASYLDSPEDSILDDFEDRLFEGHALGHNILGTAEDLKRLSRTSIMEFVKQHYSTHEIVIGISGDYNRKTAAAIVNKVFGGIPETHSIRERVAPQRNSSWQSTVNKPINQVHYVMGGIAYDTHHKHKTGLLLLNNMLGGMGMSSRLNLVVREKYGIAYTIESNYVPLSDTGIFHIYFGTDEEKADKAARLVGTQLKKLRNQKLGVMQLYQAKKKFKGQIALGEENRLNLITALAKNVLDYNQVQTLADVFEKVDAVTTDELLAIANEIFDERNLSSLCFMPE
jgi:Predicted Zn-dependent peptidases